MHNLVARVMVALALASASSAVPAGPLSACADPGLPASTTLSVCREALRQPRLAPAQRARVLVNLGVAQAALGRHRDAVQSFDLALATEAGLVAALANRARSRAALGQGDAALADFDAAIALAPRDAGLWLGRGALRLRLGRAEAARADLDRAVTLAPRNMAARFNRGLALLDLGRGAEAAADFTEVIRAEPEDAEAHLYRAEARAVAGDPAALGDYDRAVALRPDWGLARYWRGRHHLRTGSEAEADRDFLRAYDLGVTDRWLVERVEALGARGAAD